MNLPVLVSVETLVNLVSGLWTNPLPEFVKQWVAHDAVEAYWFNNKAPVKKKLKKNELGLLW